MNDTLPPDAPSQSRQMPAIRKLRSFLALPLFVKLWVIPAWVLIGLASAVLSLVPFRRVVRLLGSPLGAVSFVPRVTDAELARARNIKTAIEIAAKYAPFRSNCLPQALAAAVICDLYRVPFAFHLGARLASPVDGEAQKLDAHAWLVSGPVAISGSNASFEEYPSLACYVPQRLIETI